MKNKFVAALLSIVLAFGLWLYVVTVVSPESEDTFHDVPVVLDGVSVLEERNLMIVSSTDLNVNLKLSGNRTDLSKLDKSNITILADLSQITEAGEHDIRCTISYPSSAGAIEEQSRDPQYIHIVVAERVRKEIPVKIVYTDSVPVDYIADKQNAVLDHTTVTITGPKDVVDRITQTKIEVSLADKTANFTEKYRHTLCDAKGDPVEDVSMITASVTEIGATVRVYKLKEIPLVVEFIPGGGLTVADISYSQERQSIMVSGSAADLEKFHGIYLTIDLSKVTKSGRETFIIKNYLPDNVENVTGDPEIWVDLTIPQMVSESRTIFASQFRLENIPKGTEVRLLTEEITVEIRGFENRLMELSTEDIIVVVDFSDAQVGSIEQYAVTILIEGVSDVGAVGTYTVTANVVTPDDGPSISEG